ncbi:MAG: antA/AntB antirepressor family protein, partial [Bartonella sp.]|nr:antA/AntB antirepressor family protein [Bartonella sp.]
VNARELHAFLEVKRDFSNWIKDRINKYSFLKNQDYIVFANFGENLQGGRPSTEYHLTLDMAKELSMVEHNEKGRQARRYFIECEKKLKSQSVDYDRDTRFDLP